MVVFREVTSEEEEGPEEACVTGAWRSYHEL